MKILVGVNEIEKPPKVHHKDDKVALSSGREYVWVKNGFLTLQVAVSQEHNTFYLRKKKSGPARLYCGLVSQQSWFF